MEKTSPVLRLILILGLAAVAVPASAAVKPAVARAIKAYRMKKFEQAAASARPAAEAGDADAELVLGLVYGNGLRDSATAMKWLRRSADHGNGEAEYLYANYLEFGRDPAPAEKVVASYANAAKLGNAGASYVFALMNIRGYKNFVPVDEKRGAEWLAAAAKAGSPKAALHLGHFLHQGKLWPKDDVAAYQWVSVAANHPLSGLFDDPLRLMSQMWTEDDRRQSLRELAEIEASLTPEQLQRLHPKPRND